MKILILLTTASFTLFPTAMPQRAWAQSTTNSKATSESNQSKKKTRDAKQADQTTSKEAGAELPPVRSGIPILNKHALKLVKPRYPAIARKGHASGIVVVKILVDEEGKVISARAISGHPLLLAVSVEAARNSLFSPTRIDGTPVKVTGLIQYNFIEDEGSRVGEAFAQHDENVADVCVQDCPEKSSKPAGILNGYALKLVKPEYPAAAREVRASGLVVVRVLIDEKGKVVDAHAVSGHPSLRDVSVEAAKNSLFKPLLLSGSPVKVTGVIHYNFIAR